MSHEQAKRETNKRREEELAVAAAEAFTRTTATISAFRTDSVATSGMFFTPSEVFVSASARSDAAQSQPSISSPATILASRPARVASQISYAPLPSDDLNNQDSYYRQQSAAFFAPPPKILEQEKQNERMLSYLLKGTILSGIGAGLIIAGGFSLGCPPLAASLIGAGLLFKAIGLFCFAMATAISLRTEKQNTENGHELQNVFDKAFGEQQTSYNHKEHVFA